MNELLRALAHGGPPTFERLRRLYRRLSKSTHPDLTRQPHDAFVRLQRSYAEALSLLQQEGHCGGQSGADGNEAVAGLREAVLRTLYRYALKFNGVETRSVFDALLHLAAGYNPEIHREMLRYGREFLETYGCWVSDGRIYYAHSLWIAGIRELAYYLAGGKDRYRRLLEAYHWDLSKRAERLEARQGDTLRRLGDWLLVEAEGERIETMLEA